MSIRTKLLSGLWIISLFGLSTFTAAIYQGFASSWIRHQQDHLVRMAEWLRAGEVATPDPPNSREHEVRQVLLAHDVEGNPMLEPGGSSLPESVMNAMRGPDTGHLVLEGNTYLWQTVDTGDGAQPRLLLNILDTSPWREFTEVALVPFLITMAIVSWLCTWSALIIANLIQTLSRQKSELARARDDALSATRAKSAFLANMSHEIRTPLTAIIGFAETLAEDDSDGEQRGRILDIITRSGRHLLQIINDILDLSKIEAGRIDLERVCLDPRQLADEIRAMMQPLADEKNVQFHVEYEFPLPRQLLGDPLRIRQILLNLCGNAVKFTDSGFVRLTVRCDRDSDTLEFHVQDTGIGLSEEQLGTIFHDFNQADNSTTRKYGGTGLGLSLSRRLAEVMGGSISATSAAQVGSTFVLRLPMEVSPEAEWVVSASDMTDTGSVVAAPAESVPDLSTFRVLIADDHDYNRELMSLLLESPGIETVTTDNGEQAFRLAMEQPFDVILMDVQMPVLNGLTTTRKLREAGYGGPIIAMSANPAPDNQDECLEAGCDGFIAKPIERRSFVRQVFSYRTDGLPAMSDELLLR